MWRVRAVATRRLGRDEPIGLSPVPDDARSVARAHGADLDVGLERYVLRYQVAASGMTAALKTALSRWAHLLELCALPDWPLESFSVDERKGPRPERATTGSPSHTGLPIDASVSGHQSNSSHRLSSVADVVRSLPTADLLASLVGPWPRPGQLPANRTR